MSHQSRLEDGAGTDPKTCLSFEIRGPWAHFRRIEGNIVKQTYHLPPRTTIAGLLAAVLGIERDGYYDLFGPDVSGIAVEPRAELRTVNLPMNTLSTASGDITTVPTRGKLRIKLPNPSKPRQQHNYEMLVEPAYRIDVWLENPERYAELRNTLDEGRSHYVPSLGLSECLATIEHLGEFDIETGPESDGIAVDSAVPNATGEVVFEPGVRCQMERSPAFMTLDDGGRTTSGFTAYAYNPDAGPLTVRSADTRLVDDRTVMFV